MCTVKCRILDETFAKEQILSSRTRRLVNLLLDTDLFGPLRSPEIGEPEGSVGLGAQLGLGHGLRPLCD